MQPEDTPAKLPEGPPNSSDPVKVDSLPRSNRAADWRRYFGPGFLVAAAFIGPGTVGTAIKAGGGFGFQLLWGVGFAVFATIVFQEMAARLGLIAKMGLGEAFVNSFPNPVFRTTAIGIVFAAILFGNAAYQAGNVSGAATGLVELIPGLPAWCWVACCSLTALALIGFGSLKILKVVLVGMVLMMSFTFVVAAVLSRPDFPLLLSGCFSFEVPFYDLGILIAIIGTTVVPYNLFLHSSAVAEQNRDLDVELHQGGNHDHQAPDDDQQEDQTMPLVQADETVEIALQGTRMDTQIGVIIGGVVTASIVITAAGGTAVDLSEASDTLTPLVGSFGRVLFFLGLFAAGLTSAITAPLAAGYVYAGCFGGNPSADDQQVRRVAAGIIVIGFLIALWFVKTPSEIIVLAQIANGLILPVIAVFLLIVMNSSSILGQYRNTLVQNVLGVGVTLFVLFLGLYKLKQVFWG
jgi:manganese transport protein